jgi:hypothetical protein
MARSLRHGWETTNPSPPNGVGQGINPDNMAVNSPYRHSSRSPNTPHFTLPTTNLSLMTVATLSAHGITYDSSSSLRRSQFLKSQCFRSAG